MRRILLLLVACGWAVLNVCAQMRSRIEVQGRRTRIPSHK